MKLRYSLKRPCANCPFRTDVNHYRFAKGRIREFQRGLVRGSFPCHKTTEHDDDGEFVETGEEVHCAGALILLERIEQPSQMMRIAERIGLYDRTTLDMSAPVFGTWDEMEKRLTRD